MTTKPKYMTSMAPPLPKEQLVVMLLGKTGNGKSSLGNALLGRKKFQQTDGLVACQQHDPVGEEGKIASADEVFVIDTPGVMDNVKPDEALKGICKAISLAPNGVTAFVIVLRADSKFTEDEFKAVTQLQSLFGEKFWQHVVCVFTHGDSVLKEGGRKAFFDTVETATKAIPNFKKLMNSVGERYMVVNCKNIESKQLTEFVLLINSVRRLNNSQKYTNEMFKAAQLCYEKNKGGELVARKREAKNKLQSLEAKQAQTIPEEIEELKKQLKEQEEQIKKLRENTATAAVAKAPKECVIL
uniref:AIG1-type G domain-containing protein n=1 Tax=Macrostomum lignano TaxID=282301 RepID=A0A1I8H7N2_9PLAT